MTQNENPVEAALKQFLEAVPKGPHGLETVPLLSANGRSLAADLLAKIDDPPYSRSIMEGYVVCCADLTSASTEKPVTLEVAGSILMGQGVVKGLEPGKVLQVTTGSFIPAGDYAVLRAWDVERQENKIIVTKPVRKNENIEAQGEYRKKETLLLEKGREVTSEAIFMLASQGILEVPIACPPRIALFSSGNEVIPATAPMKTGAIWDCNQFGLSVLIKEAGGIPFFKGIVKDDFDFFTKRVREALCEVDMVVISGGTAVDGEDFTANLLNTVGVPGTLVNGIPMRSGKPIVLGVAGKKPIVCVAGHPPEAARGFGLFAKPMIRHLLGESNGNTDNE